MQKGSSRQRIALGTKAETLSRLAPAVRSARVLPLRFFSVAEWQTDPATVLKGIASEPWASNPLIVRSSARSEDSALSSEAGRNLSVADVAGTSALADAIGRVIQSYGAARSEDQVLVQPMLGPIGISGVAFTRDPNTGSPYLVINYDDRGDPTAVTGGRADVGAVREGASRTDVSAEFDTSAAIDAWLDEAGFDANGGLLLRRTVDTQGKSRAWINGSAATATQLRELG